MHVRFEPPPDETGVTVVDEGERRQVTFTTPDPVALESVSTEAFRIPVEVACSLETDYLALDARSEAFVRQDGQLVARAGHHQEVAVGPGTYTVELSPAIKLYLRVEGPLTITTGANFLRIRLENVQTVTLGARSLHERPGATITATETPRDMMRAVSHLSAALKTTSPERSFPTLRGHPPQIKLGDELAVPDVIAKARPETGIRIAVPAEYDYVYPVAPLAYYLGAQVTVGTPPRLTTHHGFEYSLTDRGPFEDSVAAVLRQSLFLDCVVRTEGLYRIDLNERSTVEADLPFDPAAVYDRPIAHRLERYLETPYRTVAPHLPDWGMTAYLPARPASVEALPFVINDLAIVRLPRGRRVASLDGTAPTGESPGDRLDAARHQPYVVPDRPDESIEHAWFADALPLDATKALVRAYRNRLDRDPPSGPLHIAVVCNDPHLAAETEVLDTVYGFHDEFPYEIDSYTNLEVGGLREVLRSDTDFLHFIGEADGGLSCPDGMVDTVTLDTTGVKTFLLNAPTSVEQALGLIEAGAVGGVATLSDLTRDDATQVGRGLARLLNLGFPLGSAVDLVRRHAEAGDRYLVVGDGMVDIAQSGGPPLICDVATREDGRYDLSIYFYPKRGELTSGAFMSPTLSGIDQQFLGPGRIRRTFTLSESALRDYLDSHSMPIRIDGTLKWNDELSIPAVQ